LGPIRHSLIRGEINHRAVIGGQPGRPFLFGDETMKVTAWIDTSVEVDIPIEQIVCELEELADDDREHITAKILNTCIGLLTKIPDKHIAILTPQQRQLVADCMGLQAARYRIETKIVDNER